MGLKLTVKCGGKKGGKGKRNGNTSAAAAPVGAIQVQDMLYEEDFERYLDKFYINLWVVSSTTS